MTEIIGKDIFYLREVTADDKDRIYGWRNLPEVTKYMFTDHHITKEEHDHWFAKILKDKSCKYWIIVYGREEIGLVNITDIDEVNKRCNYASYIASENLRGKGIGTLAEYDILKHVFDELGINKICAEVIAFNKAGINVHKSLGFKEEGFFRQHRNKNGHFLDVFALAILKSEWIENKPMIEKKLKTKGLL